MILYIAGQLHDRPRTDWAAYHVADVALMTVGYDTINPANLADDGPQQTREWYLRRAVRQVVDADGVAILPGWDPTGSLEVEVARALGMPVRRLGEWFLLGRSRSDS